MSISDLTTDPEQQADAMEEMDKLERIILDGEKTFMRVAMALKTIKDNHLYLIHAKTFSAYLTKRWSFSRTYCMNLVKAAETCANVPEIENERQARELGRAPRHLQQQIVNIVKKDGRGEISAAAIRRAVDRMAPVEDASAILVPPHLIPVFDAKARFAEAEQILTNALRVVEDLCDVDAGTWLGPQAVDTDIRNAINALRFATPHLVCPECKGNNDDCVECRGYGWLPTGVDT